LKRIKVSSIAWRYTHLRQVLADPSSGQHDDMLARLELDKAADFDPHSFDVDQANRALGLEGAKR
jgi:hypothetical protein